MAGYRTPVDLANRALQILRCPEIYSFSDPGSIYAREMSLVYDQERLAELRRACWRFSTRRAVLRPITITTQFVVPPARDGSVSYVLGDVVSYGDAYWVALSPNSAVVPGVVPTSGRLIWDSYFGPLTADVWNAASGTTVGAYFESELVFTTPGDGTYTVYRSLVSDNTNEPGDIDEWNSQTVYSIDQPVIYNGTTYIGLVNLNFNNAPDVSPTQWELALSYGMGLYGAGLYSTNPLGSNSWRTISGATLDPLNIVYPLGAGPANDYRTRNVYRLPAGFLRQAPSDPKAGIPAPFLGGPVGNITRDWVFEGDYIVSSDSNLIALRFIADVQSVPSFDPLFAEALANRLALSLASRLADAEHLSIIQATAREGYLRTISEARAINGIETGSITPAEDSWITVRR